MSRAELGGFKVPSASRKIPAILNCMPSGLLDRHSAEDAEARRNRICFSISVETFQVHCSMDLEKGLLIYTVVSKRLISGSLYNSISVVEW